MSWERPVFVFGSGFTKAFFPSAPLLIDDWKNESGLVIEDEFSGLPHVMNILATERRQNDGKINIERLLTRLDGAMPYDQSKGASQEFRLLLSKLKKVIRFRIQSATEGMTYLQDLEAFARLCIKYAIDCITFNYDHFFDKALFVAEPGAKHLPSPPHWEPDDGYGFFCKPAVSIVTDSRHNMSGSSMVLLKLHGSFNWYPILGQAPPYPIGTILHWEEWLPPNYFPISPTPFKETVARHLEPDPFIIPPVLVKSDLIEQPILRLIWAQAYDVLQKATKVVFIGYSFPVTDMASTFLFTEAIPESCEIEVVNKAEKEEEKRAIQERYRSLFRNIKDTNFYFNGALNWSRKIVAGEKNLFYSKINTSSEE
jgi:hypothetical protein